MKFSIENLHIQKNKKEQSEENTYETPFQPEGIEENIQRFCHEVLIKDQEIGSGNFGWVYKDTQENGLCYKKLQPGAEMRMNITAHSEMKFLEAAHGTYEEVKTPYPIGLAEVIVKNEETGKKRLIKVIAMEYFENSTKLEDVIAPKTQELQKDFPESFSPENFFVKLEDFIHKLHTEKGIYHRDLYSRNVLIDNETGNPIVIDFGDASYNSVDEKYDAYGRPLYGNDDKDDLDLKNVATMKKAVLEYIDNFK